MVTTATEAFRAERATVTPNGHRPERPPLRVLLGRWAGRHLPTLAAVRVAVMQWTGAVFAAAAAYTWWGLGAMFAVTAGWLFIASVLHEPRR
jgi:hypothetical protein